MTKSLAQRLLNLVDRSAMSDCWLFQGDARLEAVAAERDEALRSGAYLHDREIQHSLDASRAEDLAAGNAPSSAGTNWDETDDGFTPMVGTRIVSELITRAERAEARFDALAKALRELSECVVNGWTSPAFVRGPLHERAVEIARAALAEAGLDEQETTTRHGLLVDSERERMP